MALQSWLGSVLWISLNSVLRLLLLLNRATIARDIVCSWLTLQSVKIGARPMTCLTVISLVTWIALLEVEMVITIVISVL